MVLENIKYLNNKLVEIHIKDYKAIKYIIIFITNKVNNRPLAHFLHQDTTETAKK